MTENVKALVVCLESRDLIASADSGTPKFVPIGIACGLRPGL